MAEPSRRVAIAKTMGLLRLLCSVIAALVMTITNTLVALLLKINLAYRQSSSAKTSGRLYPGSFGLCIATPMISLR